MIGKTHIELDCWDSPGLMVDGIGTDKVGTCLDCLHERGECGCGLVVMIGNCN